jgi:hypothetical protein
MAIVLASESQENHCPPHKGPRKADENYVDLSLFILDIEMLIYSMNGVESEGGSIYSLSVAGGRRRCAVGESR